MKLSNEAEATTQRLNKQAAGSRGPKPLIQASLRRRSSTSDRGMEVSDEEATTATFLYPRSEAV